MLWRQSIEACVDITVTVVVVFVVIIVALFADFIVLFVFKGIPIVDDFVTGRGKRDGAVFALRLRYVLIWGSLVYTR